jgi:RNA polymerase II subunit A small phosphatase-like protein
MPRFDTLLVLDIDETLVYSTTTPLAYPPDFAVFDFDIYKRPHLDTFLETCASWFPIAIWTSAGDDYTISVLEHILPKGLQPIFVFTCQRCVIRPCYGEDQPYFFIKPLNKVVKYGYPLDRIIIVDDSPETYQRNYGNGIPIAKYEGDRDDEELLHLLIYLEKLGTSKNIRKIEKRYWRLSH